MSTFLWENSEKNENNEVTKEIYIKTSPNGYKIEIRGFTHIENYAKGFLRKDAGDGTAVVVGLTPRQNYYYAVYQYASDFSGTHSLKVSTFFCMHTHLCNSKHITYITPVWIYFSRPPE